MREMSDLVDIGSLQVSLDMMYKHMACLTIWKAFLLQIAVLA